MADPIIKIGLVKNVFIKMMTFVGAGDSMIGHTHTHDHVTQISAGAFEVEVDGEVTRYEAPYLVFIAADKRHIITAAEPNSVASCIHVVRGDDGVILDEDTDRRTVVEAARKIRRT